MSISAGLLVALLAYASIEVIACIVGANGLLFLMFSLPLTKQQRVQQIHFLKAYKSVKMPTAPQKNELILKAR
jgi:predicted lysophospholipase L1 biosynthesis ABC-type transport system permease subunit